MKKTKSTWRYAMDSGNASVMALRNAGVCNRAVR